MILALWDYWNYRKRRARYSDTQADAAMGAFAFVDEVPDADIVQFNIGDFVFTQRLNSFMSWAMMYITNSSVDHAGIYAGEGKIAHQMLYGAGLHSIRALAKGCRILVIRMSPTEASRWLNEFQTCRKQFDTGPAFVTQLPPKLQLLMAGFMTLHGKFPDRFRLRIWGDFFVLLLATSYAVFLTTNFLTIFVLPGGSVGLLAYYMLANLLRKFTGKPKVLMSHPDVGYQLFFKTGGLMFTRMYPIVVSDFGLLPLKVVFGFTRKGADDSADDKFEKTREFFGNLIEGWNIKEFAEKAEDNDPDQYKNE